MAKNKGARIVITLRCTNCKNSGSSNEKVELNSNEALNNKKRNKKIDYTTTKNRRNTPDRLELKKFCPKCNSHTLQKELK